MWLYSISARGFYNDTPEGCRKLCDAYSGFERGKDMPSFQREKGIGPIPAGAYWIGDELLDESKHGPVAMPLLPTPHTETFGRGEFMIHGDSKEHPGMASHGCIILPRQVRERIAAARNRLILVVSGGV